MESNIKGLVAAGHEMASELKAECGAVDMRSVAKLISDLATQLEVQLVRANALAEDQQKAIESIKQADAAVKLAHEKFSALAAENAAMHETIEAVRSVADNSSGIAGWHLNGESLHGKRFFLKLTISKPQPPTLSWLKYGRRAWRWLWSICSRAVR